MRKNSGLHIGLAIFAFFVVSPRLASGAPQAVSRAATGEPATIDVKMKCGFDENGSFGCKKVKKHKTEESDESKPSKSGNICAGVNDCGPGYRDLSRPNKYGACCEAETTPSKTDEQSGPKTGKCMQVAKMSDLSCSAPFGAYSCGPLQNGVMNCCCVK